MAGAGGVKVGEASSDSTAATSFVVESVVCAMQSVICRRVIECAGLTTAVDVQLSKNDAQARQDGRGSNGGKQWLRGRIDARSRPG